jgi:TPR repeat protein
MPGNAQRRQAAGRGAAWLLFALVLMFCAGSGYALGPDDLTLIVPAAERGGAASQVLLAVAYLNGDGGLERNPAKAAYWFEQAAIQGNAYAEERLGDLYEQGLGVRANPKLAFDWRLKAANRGSVGAQLKVGKMYQDGFGVGKDIEQARHWFHRAATEGNAEAQYRLGRLYHYGSDAEVDRAVARSWFEKAAQQGYEAAIEILNLIESIGYQLDEGWHHRLPGLKKLANDGDLEAEYQLAQRYEHGIGGVRKDPATAVDWYRRAAQGGHLMAMRALAQIYATGRDGVERDPAAATAWAARAGGAAH